MKQRTCRWGGHMHRPDGLCIWTLPLPGCAAELTGGIVKCLVKISATPEFLPKWSSPSICMSAGQYTHIYIHLHDEIHRPLNQNAARSIGYVNTLGYKQQMHPFRIGDTNVGVPEFVPNFVVSKFGILAIPVGTPSAYIQHTCRNAYRYIYGCIHAYVYT